MTLAIKGKRADDRWVDYCMSEKFGLDWMNYDSQRIEDFRLIMHIKNDLLNKEQNGKRGLNLKNNRPRS